MALLTQRPQDHTMANEQQELKPSKRTSTMPVPPSPKKSFFKRAFTSSGKKEDKRNSTLFSHSPESPSRPQSQDRPPPQRASTGTPTRSSRVIEPQHDGQTEGASLADDAHERYQTESSTATANDSAIAADYADAADPSLDVATPADPVSEPSDQQEEQEQQSTLRQDSKGARIKFAEHSHEQSIPPRPRRTSSGVSRRPSIFTKREVGVDAGVGSKARRFSVAVSDDTEFEVDEVPLKDNFSFFDRKNKKPLGEGGAAHVHQMRSKNVSDGKSSDKLFAVKEFRERDEEEESVWDYERKIKSEFAIAKSLEHPNIVETYKLCYSEHRTKWHHVMELCEENDLNELIKKQYFSLEDKNCMIKQLIRGIEYLHSRGIAHRDLKSENLLLTKDGCLKIADFGTSEVFSGSHPGARRCRRPSLIDSQAEIRYSDPGLVGSRPYMAPEIMAHEQPYDPRAADIWSCGIVYVTIIQGGTPWQAASTDINNYNIYCHTWDQFYEKHGSEKKIGKEGPFPAFAMARMIKDFKDPAMLYLALRMLHPDPKERISAHEALLDQTVIDFPCCQQTGYSDDIKTRQRKAMHKHCPPQKPKGGLIKSPR